MTNFEKLQKFVYERLERCDEVKTRAEVHNLRAIAFGAVQFFQSLDEVPYETIHDFWDEDVYDKFYEKMKEKG